METTYCSAARRMAAPSGGESNDGGAMTMKARGSHRICFFALVLIALFDPMAISAQAATDTAPPKIAQEAPVPRDGQHDFDFLIGEWKYQLSRLVHPLTGSSTWVEFEGTGICFPVWNGLAQLDQLEADGPTGHIQGLTLRLYNPTSHQWSLNWANSNDGTLGVPTVGAFKNGRGEFFDQETFNGRSILVRYVWSDITPTSARFEQSFSDDGGKTWEPNWITTQVRVQK
jgi:hypothetical protein